MVVKAIPLTFLILMWGIAVSAADTAQVKDSTAKLPQLDEFIPVETVAEMVYYEQPDYPDAAERFGIQGLVWVKALVGADGAVWDVAIYRSSGSIYLDLAALEAAPRCRFKPAVQDGRPVAMWVTYKVDFLLEGEKSKRAHQALFWVESRVDTVVSTVWNDSLPEATSPANGLGSDSTGSYVLTDSAGAPRYQKFGILVLKETDDTRSGRQKAVALIDGGCANGLKIGMTGSIWDDSGDDSVKLANVEVTDVQAFESLCTVQSLKKRLVSEHNQVTIGQPPLRPAELLARGEWYYESGLREKALACYEAISALADSNALVSSHLEDCRKEFGLDAIPKTAEDSTALRKRIPGWLTVANAYIRLNNPSGTRRYARKILSFDSTNDGALELLTALNVYDDCKIDIRSLMPGSGDTTKIETLPRIARAGYAGPRVPPGDYYSDWYPKDKKQPDSVYVRALVSSKGKVLRAEVHRSSGMPALDRAAVESAFETKFDPGISCGRPVAMWVKWKVEFTREWM